MEHTTELRISACCRVLLLTLLVCVCPASAQNPAGRTSFRVKYIAEGVVYIDGGRNSGLTEGEKLVIRRRVLSDMPSGDGLVQATRIVAELAVISLADGSAVCEIRASNAPIRVGDIAALDKESLEARLKELRASPGRKYPQVIAFTVGEPLDEEARDAVPHPPLPEINRARGRVGVEYSGTRGTGGSTFRSDQVGLVLRADVTRIGGSYWNFNGYWHGRLDSRSSSSQQTLNDLINRTYQIGLIYVNPQSHWTAGLGRLYVPWATSLSTVDGGYVARRFGKGATLGIFAGSTPDPTSWDYNPDRHIGGVFANFEGGSFDAFRYTSTMGVALSTIAWKAERQFLFFENVLSYKRGVSVYHSLEADAPRTLPQSGPTGAAVSRSFLTIRMQPHRRVSFDLSHNYFRDLPTFDPRLVGTGLLDKYLFQGFSGGMRVDLPWHLGVYSSLGRSSRNSDAKPSWNQLYGVTLGQVWKTGIRADLRYSTFDSSFGRGHYKALSLSRQFGEGLRWEVQTGMQNFTSALTQQSNGRFVNTNLDWFIGRYVFLEGGFTLQRGNSQDYNQWIIVMGSRF
jgi:hypothetical protein